jgi:hypothetical protein
LPVGAMSADSVPAALVPDPGVVLDVVVFLGVVSTLLLGVAEFLPLGVGAAVPPVELATVVAVTATAVVVDVAVDVVHEGGEIESASRVTAPLRARTAPDTVTPDVTVMELNARMVPVKPESVPSVAELPTCQYTLQACAPFVRLTWLAVAVVSDEPAWKMKTALGSPCPSSVRVPVRPTEDAEL